MRKVLGVLGAVVAIGSLLVGSVEGTTHHVPAQYPTIQMGVNAAVSGDTVLVAPGIYRLAGNCDIQFGGRRLVVRSSAGAESTVIDCGATPFDLHRAFFIHEGETSGRIAGFTIRNGRAATNGGIPQTLGGGVCVYHASMAIEGCVVQSCFAGLGGGIGALSSTITVENCQIVNNGAERGAGFFSDDGTPVILDSFIAGNTAGGTAGGVLLYVAHGGAIRRCKIVGNIAGVGGGMRLDTIESLPVTTIEESIIAGNAGGGVDCYAVIAGRVQFNNCTITGNNAIYGGGISLCTSAIALNRTIIRDNCADQDDDVSVTCFEPPASIVFSCCAFNPAGLGAGGTYTYSGPQVVTDPRFCIAVSCENAPQSDADYSLRDDSPCLPAQSPCGVLVGAVGLGCVVDGVSQPAGADLNRPRVELDRNPVRAVLSGRLLGEIERGELEIFDVAGRSQAAVWTGRASGSESFTYPVPAWLRNGVYFLRLRTPGGISTLGFVLAR